MGFALETMLRRVPERLNTRLGNGHHGRDQAQRILEERLPLDAERHSEALVWLALLAKARVDSSFDELRQTAWRGERYVCRLAVAEIAGCPAPSEIGDRLPTTELEAEAADLHTYVDGLTVQGTTFREYLPPDQQRRLLRRRIDAVRAAGEDGN